MSELLGNSYGLETDGEYKGIDARSCFLNLCIWQAGGCSLNTCSINDTGCMGNLCNARCSTFGWA